MYNETRTVTTGVRPPRVAVFIDVEDPHWMQTCLRVIEWTTALWGGWCTIIVPTDGKTIGDEFCALLVAFDPDYLLQYAHTGLDPTY